MLTEQRIDSQMEGFPPLSKLPRVSVIIPTYNSARFITQALDTVFCQNYNAYEVIVVDDGSTDNTLQVLEPYHDRIRFVRQKNAGSAAARNTGLDMARGEFIVFLDADDLMLPGKLREQAAYLQLRPSLGLVHSGWRIINEGGEVIREKEPWHDAPKLNLETWLRKKPVKMGAMMFRRLWLDSVGGLDPEIRQSHDVDLLLRLSLTGCEAEWIYKSTMCYRQYAASTIRRNAWQQYKYVVMVMDKFYTHPKLPDRIKKWEQKGRYYTLTWVAWHLHQNGNMADMIAPLRHAFNYSPYDEPIGTVLDWANRLTRYMVREGYDLEGQRAAWPYLKEAAQIDSEQWALIERLLNWQLDKRPIPDDWESHDLRKVWPIYEAAIEVENEELSAEIVLDWWVSVWWNQLYDSQERAIEMMPSFKRLPIQELVRLVQFCVAQKPGRVIITGLTRFWQDAEDTSLISNSQRLETSAAYLTLLGQKALGGKWREALGAGSIVVRMGFQPQVWRSWRRFLRSGLDYYWRRDTNDQ